MRKQLLILLTITFSLMLSARAQQQVYGDLHVYGNIKNTGLKTKATADTLIMYNNVDSNLYKVAISDINITSTYEGDSVGNVYVKSLEVENYILLKEKDTTPAAKNGRIYLDRYSRTLRFHNGIEWREIQTSTVY